MSIRASNKRWIAALSAALMVCVCASASAQNYSLGDEADEVATIQTALKQLKLYSAGITILGPTAFSSITWLCTTAC